MPKDSRIQNTILTGRLNLNIIQADDHDFIQSLVNSKGWIDNIGDRNIHAKTDAIAYINKILGTENAIYWVVRIQESDTPVGIISLLKRDYLEDFDIGFAFLPHHHGKGYAYEAAKAVLGILSKLPEFKTMLATTLFSNQNSIKLLTKLGFRFEKEIERENQKLHIYSNAARHRPVF